MKILIATGIFPPDIGGPATYSHKIAVELTKRGNSVVVLTYSNEAFQIFNFQFPYSGRWPNGPYRPIFNKLPITSDKVESPRRSRDNYQLPIVRTSRKSPLFLRYFIYFLKVLWCGRNVDVIFLQDPVSAGLPATLANLFLRKKLVLKVVGDYAWEQAVQIKDLRFKISDNFINLDEFYPFEPSKYPPKIRLCQKIQTWVAKRADKIITPSEYLKGIVKKWGVDGEKILVVYNAADLPEINVQKESGVFTIISVGRLVSWKGYNGLIEAFAELIKSYPNLRLKIVGEGPEKKNFQFSIINFQLQDKIQLLGALSHEETLKEMAKASLFVLNTAYEGLSHVILEALAVGTPVVTTAAGGNPEVIKDGWNGILVKYNDLEALKSAIIKIIDDKEFRDACVRNGFASLQKFNEHKMIEETLKILFNFQFPIPNSQ